MGDGDGLDEAGVVAEVPAIPSAPVSGVRSRCTKGRGEVERGRSDMSPLHDLLERYAMQVSCQNQRARWQVPDSSTSSLRFSPFCLVSSGLLRRRGRNFPMQPRF